MMLSAAVGLPLLVIPLVLLPRRRPSVPPVATLVGLVGTAVLVLLAAGDAPLVVFGRAIGLTALTAAAVALSCGLLAVVVLHTVTAPMDRAAYAISLGTISVLTVAVAVRNAIIGGLVLEIGLLIAALLIPLRRRDTSIEGMRVLVVLALLLPLILLASVSLGEGSLPRADRTETGHLALAGMLLLALGLTPFHVWLGPLFRRGPALTVVLFTVVLGIVVLAYAAELLGWADAPQQTGVFSDLLLYAGLASVLFGGVAALGQRSLGRVLAFAALTDMGVAAIGLGLGGPQNLVAAMAEVTCRGAAITATAVALSVFRRRLGGDDDYHLRGAVHRVPLSVLGATLALLSLAGFPLTAGFSTRLPILTSLARQNGTLTVVVALASMGPIWAIARGMRMAYAPLQYPDEVREPRLSGALVLVIGIMLVLWGTVPRWIPFLPTAWLRGWLSAV